MINILQIVAVANCDADGNRSVNGPERRSANVIQEWRKFNIQPTVFYPHYGRMYSIFKNSNAVVIDGSIKGKFDIASIIYLYRSIKKLNVDLIHVQGPGSVDDIAIVIGKILGVPVIISRVSMISDLPLSKLRKKIYFTIDKFILRQADHVVAVSKSGYQHLLQETKISSDKLSLIYNGIQKEKYRFIDNDQLSKFRIQHELDKADKVIVMIGQFYRQKGWYDYFNLVKKLKKETQGANFKALVVGDGVLKNELLKFVKVSDLEDVIVFTGFLEDVRPALLNADLFVLPSYREGLPVAIIEAMFSRLPVIAYNVGGIADQIEQGYNGYLLQAGDQLSLFDRSLELLLDDKKSQEFGARSYEIACNKFTQDKMVKKYAETYKNLCR
ncbi:MAG: glycosyltransferase family 4 protein [bacterium]|nr:glycosyltransferase family 4 protein [bacterium]